MIYGVSSTDNKSLTPPRPPFLSATISFSIISKWDQGVEQLPLFTVDECSRLIILPITIPWDMSAPTEFG